MSRSKAVINTTKPDESQLKKTGRRCDYCGQAAPLIWVHGHGQCAACGINVQECCQGESCRHGN